jgi:photosystem II stability/assembly factor-like uncharacterized protein
MRRILFATLILLVLGAATVLALPRGEHAERTERACAQRTQAELQRELARERAAGKAEGTATECGALETEEISEPLDAALARQLTGSETTPDLGYRQARAQAARLGDDGELDGRWQQVGTRGIGGRVLDITVDPELPDTIFVGTASGGVWKSTDAGETYDPAWPADANQAIGALAQGPDGTLYAGTGEAGPGGGSLTYGGDGVYRSRDRGRTWEMLGLETSSRIGRILVDPHDPQRIWVAAIGPLYRAGGERGLYRSDDGGDSWQRVLRPDNETTGAVDVAVDPQDPKIVYATTWQNLREPDRRLYTGVGSGLYKSTDGGESFRRIGPGLFGPSPLLGRMGITVGPKDRKLYVIATGESGLYQGLWVSSDQGTTFTPLPDAQQAAINGQFVYGWWFGRVWVNPEKPGSLYVAGVNLSKSANGGQTWSVDSRNHADHHALAWDPKVPGRVYNGHDGGVNRSDDDTATWEERSPDQHWTQLYSLDVSQQDTRRAVQALQDNGDVRSFNNAGEPNDEGMWREYNGGDGVRAVINPADDTTYYGCSQYGACSRFKRNGATTSRTSFENSIIGSRKNWSVPIEFEPGKERTTYTGSEILHRSTDDGVTWSPVSPELTNGPGRETNPLFKNYGTITTIAPARGGRTIYVGTDDGNLWFTHTGGGVDPTQWTKAADADLPKAWITRVEVDPDDAQTAYVTYSGYRTGEDAAYVLKTTDGGKSWMPISRGLPRAPVNDINIIGKSLVVATDVGVFRSKDDGRKWKRVGEGLPLAPVFELRHVPSTNELYAATFGRSMWKLDLGG